MITSKTGILVAVFLLVVLVPLVSAEIIWSNPSPTTFITSSQNSVCKYVGGNWIWEKSVLGNIQTVLSENDCYREDGVNTLGIEKKECCPDDKTICDPEQHICVPSVNPGDTCEDYTLTECSNLGNSQRAIDYLAETDYPACGDTIYSSGPCWIAINCICAVNEDSCLPTKQYKTYNGTNWKYFPAGTELTSLINQLDEECGTGNYLSGNCGYSIEETNDCENGGFRTLDWTKIWDGDAGLTDSGTCTGSDSKKMPCPAQLGFASFVGLTIAVALVVLFYLISLRKRGKEKIKKKKRR